MLDPYVNAVHVSLLREKQLNPVYAEHFKKIGAGTDAVRELGEKLLAGGPEKLKPSERMAVLADQGVMVWLHQQAWLRPGGKTRAVVEGDDPRIQPPGIISPKSKFQVQSRRGVIFGSTLGFRL